MAFRPQALHMSSSRCCPLYVLELSVLAAGSFQSVRPVAASMPHNHYSAVNSLEKQPTFQFVACGLISYCAQQPWCLLFILRLSAPLFGQTNQLLLSSKAVGSLSMFVVSSFAPIGVCPFVRPFISLSCVTGS